MSGIREAQVQNEYKLLTLRVQDYFPEHEAERCNLRAFSDFTILSRFFRQERSWNDVISKSAPLNKEKVFYDSAIHFLNSSKDILPIAHSSRFSFAVALQA